MFNNYLFNIVNVNIYGSKENKCDYKCELYNGDDIKSPSQRIKFKLLNQIQSCAINVSYWKAYRRTTHGKQLVFTRQFRIVVIVK